MPNAHLTAALKAQAEQRKTAKKATKTSGTKSPASEAAKPADSNPASNKEN